MIYNFFGITFGTIQNIVFSPLIILFVLICIYRYAKIKSVVSLLTDNVNQKDILLNFSKNKVVIKFILLVLSLMFLFFSLLSPQWNKKQDSIKQEGRDIFIALDISRSMLAKDFMHNRLVWSKAKIKSLLSLLKSDRVGLILFSGSAFVQCPLTRDFSAFYMFLDQADPEMVSSGTTSIDQAIKVALDKFKSDEAKKNKLLIVFTDGEDFSSNLSGIKDQAIKQGLSIFTIGVGTTQGAPVPLLDNSGRQTGHQLDAQGSPVISKLNEGILKALSQSCGGIYIHGTQDAQDINTIAKKVEFIEKQKFEDKKVSYFEEQYPYFVLISFICLIIEWLL